MDLLKFVARRSYLSEVIYVLLNVALALGVWFLVSYFGSPVPAYGLILLSKWRIFSVRPRFWLANIQSNAVDILAGFGFAALISGVPGSLPIQTMLTLLYAGWLLYLKPRSTKSAIALQAAIAQLIALSAIFLLSYNADPSVVVLVSFAIGFAAAKHVLGSYEERAVNLLSFVWGFIVAELSWVGFHMGIVFTLPFASAGPKFPAVALVVTALGYIAAKYYTAIADGESEANVKALRWHAVVTGIIVLFLVGFPFIKIMLDPTSLNT